MHILLLQDSYPPEVSSTSHLAKELAEGLRGKGHRVSVVTSYPKYYLAQGGERKTAYPAYRNEEGIRVVRVKTLPHHKVNFFVRGIAELTLPYIFFCQIRRHIKDTIDVVLVHTPPLPLAITAQRVKRAYGARFILNVHDIFPQNAVDLGILTQKPIIKFFEKIERRAYRNADIVMVPSESHKQFLAARRNVPAHKITIIPHWIDTEPFQRARRTEKFRKLWGLEDKFIFLFAGVLGPSQGLDLVLAIARRLKDNSEITFLLVGDGTDKERLMQKVKALDLDNVIFSPFVSKTEYPFLVKDADVGLVCLSHKNTTPAVPAKILGYMAASLPVVAFLHKESDGHALIRESGCGLTTLSDNEEGAYEIVLRMYQEKEKRAGYGTQGLRYALQHLTKESCVEKLEALLSRNTP